ncbi:MAG: hypothetical protein RL748_1345 [Pseudomonadota bacterium]|jgi:hypothetical protein
MNQPAPALLARLGQDVLALQVEQGKAPANCFGISLAAGLMQHHLGPVSQPKHGKLWWVSCASMKLRFAPMANAPEAGVELTFCPWLIQQEPQEALALWLDGQASVVTLPDLARYLQNQAIMQWPPCMQEEEWISQRKALEAMMGRKLGLRCQQLVRCDLYPQVNCAQQDRQPHHPNRGPNPNSSLGQIFADPAQQGSANHGSPAGVGDAAGVGGADGQVGAEAQANAPHVAGAAAAALGEPETRAQWLALDQTLAMQIFLQLPQLAKRLRQCPWPQNPVLFAEQRRVLAKLDQLVSTSGRWPSLDSPIDPQRLSPGQIRLLCRESRKAQQGLDQCWAVLEADSAQGLALGALGQHVLALEQAIARRRTPWWELS